MSMKMNIEDKDSMNSDTLIVIHLLNEFYRSLKADQDVSIHSTAHKNLKKLREDVLDDLLWGGISYGNYIRDWPFRYIAAKEPPMQELLELLLEYMEEDIDCTYQITKYQLKQLQEIDGIKYLDKLDPDDDDSKDTIEVWDEIKAKTKNPETHHTMYYIEAKFGESASVWRAILRARGKLFFRRFKELRRPEDKNSLDDTYASGTKNFRPIDLDFLSNWQKIFTVLKRVEEEYLEAFQHGHVTFVDNPMVWDKKLKYLMPILRRMHHEHGPFWISLDRLAKEQVIDAEDYWQTSLQLPETLFALQTLGSIAVTKCKGNQHQDIDFRVHSVALDEGEQIIKKEEGSTAPPKSNEVKDEPHIPYANMLTFVGQKQIVSKDGAREERFNEGYLIELWKFLLVDNVGKVLTRKAIEQHLRSIESHQASGKIDLENILEGLVQKLARVSGKKRSEVRRWFIKDREKLYLTKSK